MNDPTADIKNRLGELHGLEQRTRAEELKIVEAARARLTVIEREIEQLRARAQTDPAAAQTYQARIIERGRLAVVIASAHPA